MTKHTVESTARLLCPAALELGECPRWVNDELVLVDILEGRLYRLSESTAPALGLVFGTDGEPLGAVAPLNGHPDQWVAAIGQGIAVIDGSGVVDWLARLEPPTHRMNDGVADPSGRFWAGSMALDGEPGGGSLYRVDHDRRVTRVLSDITIVNGPAFTQDGTTMYLSDSGRGVVHRFAVDPGSGNLGQGHEFATFADGSPDGLTVDVDGWVWVAVWGTGQVHRYRPDGTLVCVVNLGATNPTAVCLGGPDLKRLLVTTATFGLAEPGPGDGAVWEVDVAVPGLPTTEVRLQARAVR